VCACPYTRTPASGSYLTLHELDARVLYEVPPDLPRWIEEFVGIPRPAQFWHELITPEDRYSVTAVTEAPNLCNTDEFMSVDAPAPEVADVALGARKSAPTNLGSCYYL
jgi:hypothetical protein